MRIAITIFGCIGCCIAGVGLVSPAQSTARSLAPGSFFIEQNTSPPSPIGDAVSIDGMVARIEDDVLTESEVRELGEFQALVDGHAKPRAELIRELVDQWIVRGEANSVKYPQPTPADVDRAYAQLATQFPSLDEFKKRYDAAGLSEAGVRRILLQQLFLSRFLDYRFRPSARIDDDQIKKYYEDEFTPQLRARNQAIPALDDVDDTIREVLTLRAIGDSSQQWLEETRARLKIEVLAPADKTTGTVPPGASR